MQRSKIKSFGLVLSFSALFVFFLHPIHALAEVNAGSDAHCCVCHTVPMGASLAPADHSPVVYVEFAVPVPEEAHSFGTLLLTESPRGPPCA